MMSSEQLENYRYIVRHCGNDAERAELREVEEFVAAIPDDYVRRMVAARYIKGLTWSEIAACFYPNSADGCRMIVRRYLRSIGVG